MAQDGFSIVVSQDGDGSATVTLAGEFDLSTSPELRERLSMVEALGPKRVLVDLTGVTFFDSTSIGVLVSACKRVRNAGGAFSVCCAEGGIVLRMLQISGLVEFFEVTD